MPKPQPVLDQYWFFKEADLQVALRAWACDPTQHPDHNDEAACRERFDTVNRFLYSSEAREKKMLNNFILGETHK